jgi:propionyl-CoA carboxylase beta chain
MSWRAGVEELRRRQAMTARMGGPDEVARQASAGKPTVRGRIAALLDAGTFREIGSVSDKAGYDAESRLVDLLCDFAEIASQFVRPEPARVQYRP